MNVMIHRHGTVNTTRNSTTHRPYCGESTRPIAMYPATIAPATATAGKLSSRLYR